jgi:hypothetical protein
MHSTCTHPSDQLRPLNCRYAIHVAANKDGVNRRQNMRRVSRSIMHERIASQVMILLCWKDEGAEEGLTMLVPITSGPLHRSSLVRPPNAKVAHDTALSLSLSLSLSSPHSLSRSPITGTCP